MTARSDPTGEAGGGGGRSVPSPGPTDSRLPFPYRAGGDTGGAGGQSDARGEFDWQAYIDSGWTYEDLVAAFDSADMDPPQGLVDAAARTEARELYLPSWLRDNPALADVWLDEYVDSGNARFALEAVRRDPNYDELFPGNRRDDGSIRYSEDVYLGRIESYADALLSVNLNPDLFSSYMPGLIEGLVSPAEFASRVNSMYDRVLESTEEIRNYYAKEFAFDMSTEAIVASFMHPDIGAAFLNRQISISEVGGSASARNFTIGADIAEEMVNYGVDTLGEAQSFFAQAESVIPTMSVLAARHADPDDDFDLAEFTNATLFGDPEQRRRMRRLSAQERASFGADRGLTITRSQGGSLTGLTER